ncbi:MAG: biopolymer transporter ExbD [Acidobacteriota bacterium]
MKLKRKEEEPEIPTASMADIAFLLIVFFMLTSVFAETRGINFALPPKTDEEEEQTDSEREEAVSIHINEIGQILVDDSPLVEPMGQELYNYLQPKILNWAEKPILVTAEKTAPYGAFVEVYDALQQVERTMKERGELKTRQLKVSILSLAEIERLKEAFGEDIFG